MTAAATGEIPLKWDVLVTKRQGLTRDLPPGIRKLRRMTAPESSKRPASTYAISRGWPG
jgi:hypothetical protein